MGYWRCFLIAKVSAYHHESFHFILVLYRQLVDIHNGGVAAAFNFAVLFDSLEDVPAVLAILYVARKAIGDEERFHGLRSYIKTRLSGRK